MKTINIIRLIFITIVLLTACNSVLAQKPENADSAGARVTMMKFIELNNGQSLQTDVARRLFSGNASEWKDKWFGQIFSQPDKIVMSGKNHSVARLQSAGKNLRVVDLYFYLEHKEDWTIYTMRAMAQTGWLESIKSELSGKTVLTAEEKQSLANAELTLSSDKTLTEWFQKNRSSLDNLANLALVETKPKPKKVIVPPKPKIEYRNGMRVSINPTVGYGNGDSADAENRELMTLELITATTAKFPRTAAAIKRLHFSALEKKGSGNLEIVIGGITDNTVGFLYSPSGKPPAIDGWRYIWVEQIAEGWYLFRTT